MRLPLYVSALAASLFLCASAAAQQWKTVAVNDTTYFAGGRIGRPTDSTVLRVIWIDSVAGNGGDSAFYFYKALRYDQPCIDLNGDSWLGPAFIRLGDGDELYFNALGDTIRVKTNAAVGDSWVFYQKGSRSYLASVSQVGTMSVDGDADSVKTVTLQAYDHNLAVWDWYNSLQLVLSKRHGWLETLDMYRFPDLPQSWPYNMPGAIPDSAQHRRLTKRLALLNVAPIKSFDRYAPGNEWIQEFFGSSSSIRDYVHDSVVAVQPIGANGISATIKTREVTKDHSSNVVSRDTVYIRTVTAYPDTSINLVGTYALPEFNRKGAELGGSSSINPHFRRYYVDSVCPGRLLFQSRIVTSSLYGLQYNNGCLFIPSGINGEDPFDWDYLEGFGRTYERFESTSLNPSYSVMRYIYIKLGACITGTPINLSTLQLTTAVAQESGLSLVPVPAITDLRLAGQLQGHQATVRIFDLSGRSVAEWQHVTSDKRMDVTHLQAGMYIAEITIGTEKQMQRIMIAR